MEYLKNVSNKIIGGLGESLLPGDSILYTDGLKKHPTVKFYLSHKILKLTDDAKGEDEEGEVGVSDEEKRRIAQEAVAAYQKELEEKEQRERLRQEEILEIKKMKKKSELEAKAVELGVELTGSDTNEQLQEKLIAKVKQ